MHNDQVSVEAPPASPRDLLRYDLHCHSDQSDGILSPEALVSRAKLHKVSVLALTDHDTINGIDRASAQARLEGIELINGIEFSCQWAGRSIHIVALRFDKEHPAIAALISSQAKLRFKRSALIAQKMEALGFDNALERAREQAGSDTIGRPHFAKAMVAAGFCATVEQAFKRHLGAGKPGDVKEMWPEFGDVLPVIEEAGGVAVLAHPLKYKMTRTKLCKMLDDFVALGGKAMEVISGDQRREHTQDMARIANKYGLLASCGSDFHAPSSHWNELGRCSVLPDSVTPVWSFWEKNTVPA